MRTIRFHRPAARALLAGLALLPMLAAAQPAVDGRWKAKDSSEIVSFKTGNGHVTMAASTGAGYTARLDGSDAPYHGDKVVDTVSVSMPDTDTLVETSKKDGKAWLTMRMQVDASGKTAKVSWTNLRTGKSGGYELVRQ